MDNFAKLKASTVTAMLNLDVTEATDSAPNLEGVSLEQQAYILGLLNYSDQIFTHGASRGAGETEWKKPFTLGPVKKNCGSIGNREQCIKDKAFAVLWTVYCNDSRFDVFLGWRSSPTELTGAVYENVTPDCRYAGVIFDFE